MSAVDAIAGGYRQVLAGVSYCGGGELVSLPVAYASGALVTVLVTVDRGVATVSDRGQAADELAAAGLDVSKRTAVGRAFAAVRNSTGLAQAAGAKRWEITASVDEADVAAAVQAVASAALRADGVRVALTVARSPVPPLLRARRTMQPAPRFWDS